MSYSSLLVQDLITSVPTWLLQYPCTWLPRQWGAQTAVETMTANNSLKAISVDPAVHWNYHHLESDQAPQPQVPDASEANSISNPGGRGRMQCHSS